MKQGYTLTENVWRQNFATVTSHRLNLLLAVPFVFSNFGGFGTNSLICDAT